MLLEGFPGLGGVCGVALLAGGGGGVAGGLCGRCGAGVGRYGAAVVGVAGSVDALVVGLCVSRDGGEEVGHFGGYGSCLCWSADRCDVDA